MAPTGLYPDGKIEELADHGFAHPADSATSQFANSLRLTI